MLAVLVLIQLVDSSPSPSETKGYHLKNPTAVYTQSKQEVASHDPGIYQDMGPGLVN